MERLQGSTLDALQGVVSRPGADRSILGLVTDDPEWSVAGLMQADDHRWPMEPWGKDVKPLWGLGHYPHRSSQTAGTHRPLGCWAYARLPHLRRERSGAQGAWTPKQAADRSTAAAQDQLRG